MKKYIFILIIPVLCKSQLTNTENYISNKTYLAKGSDTVQKPPIEEVTYFDGLGRPKQSILVKTSTDNKDLVTPIFYDQYGRQLLEILPIPINSNQGGFHYNVNEITANNTYSGMGLGGNAFSQNIFENSPFNKLSEQYGPGDLWKINDKPTVFTTQANGNDVKLYTVITDWTTTNNVSTSSNLVQSNGYYPANSLYAHIKSDEDGHLSYEYKNSKGQTVLIRKIIGSKLDIAEQGLLAQPGGLQKSDTYYVYNKYDQLVLVIPPLASSTANLSDVIDTLCYQYRYDGKNRLVEKKIPGKGWEYMVYDKADRLIMTQDQNLKSQNKWLITKYDIFGRIIYTGFISGGERQSMQSQAGDLVIIENRDSTGFVLNGISIYYSNNYFTDIDTALSINYYDSYPSGTPFPNQNQILNEPILLSTEDNLGRSTKSLSLAKFVKNVEDDRWTKNYDFYDIKGRLLGTTSVNHLGGSTIVNKKLDFSGIVQKTETLHKRSSRESALKIEEDFVYDNHNKLLKHYHEVVGKTPKELLSENIYDEFGRIVTKNVGSGSDSNFSIITPFLQSVKYNYNIRGWITGINLNNIGNLDTAKLFSFKVKYNDAVNNSIKKYNGNVSEIDWTYGTDSASRYEYIYDGLDRLKRANYKSVGVSETIDSKYFNEEITYDVNGNIRTLKRNARPRTGQTAVLVDNLVYNYENNNKSNRITTIYDSSQNTSGYPALPVPQPITYDINGNMLTMPDKGITQNMTYNFLNLPQIVSKNGQTVIYSYRADGTKINKNFGFNNQQITTDYLDGFVYTNTYTLEIEMALRETPSVEEMSIAGQKESLELAEKQIKDSSGPITLMQSSPSFFPTAEGFYDYENFRYIYQYKDHLGNSRLNYGRDSDGMLFTEDSNNYYPFGLNFINSTSLGGPAQVYNPSATYKNYKFQEQELQEMGWYSFKWRNYDPSIGRFFNIDPLSEKYSYQSHYNFSENRVTDGRELEGLEYVKSTTSGLIQHYWKSTNKANSVGVDYVHETKTTYNTHYDVNNVPVAQSVVTSISDGSIDKKGGISQVQTYVSTSVQNMENGATATTATTYNTDINSNVVSDTFKTYTGVASNFKKSDDGGSLVQVKAVENRSNNEVKGNVAMVLAIVSKAVDKLPVAQAKTASQIIGGLATGATMSKKTENANEITLTIPLKSAENKDRTE